MLYQATDANRKAGMAEDKEGAEALAQILVWLRRWKRGELPRAEAGPYAGGAKDARQVWRWPEAWWLEQLDEDSEDDTGAYAGGKRKRTCEQTVGEAVVSTQEIAQPMPFEGQVAARIEDWLEENLMGDKASSTERAYAGSWAKWQAWARRQGWESEYLNRKADPVENENKVMAFIGYLGCARRISGYPKAGSVRHQGCAQEGRSRRPHGKNASPMDSDQCHGEKSN